MSRDVKYLIMKISSQSNLARSLGCKQQTVSLWLNRKVPNGKVLLLSEAVGWKVTPHQIRPDLYPGVFDGLPETVRLTDFTEIKE
ncbi:MULTISPECIES: transcriptional regulator [unclassified Serratia (in: enterobacteria)]|uniref:transcriptional regulator n=1 Tax=unclassified Serratia (in: enterobacteria) TaxID=2647522 RepID=UPI003075EF48